MKEIFRDDKGNYIGSADEHNGRTIFRGAKGEYVGSAQVLYNGKVVYRDAHGSPVATRSAPF